MEIKNIILFVCLVIICITAVSCRPKAQMIGTITYFDANNNIIKPDSVIGDSSTFTSITTINEHYDK